MKLIHPTLHFYFLSLHDVPEVVQESSQTFENPNIEMADVNHSFLFKIVMSETREHIKEMSLSFHKEVYAFSHHQCVTKDYGIHFGKILS